METKLESFTEYCKNFIIDNLPEYEDNEKEQTTSEIGYLITEGINVDGSATYSTSLAIDYIREWWNDAAEYYQYEIDNFGSTLHNPFEEPEAYQVCMIIAGVNALLSKCEFISDNWNEDITLSENNINTIIEQINEVEEISL